MQILSFNRKPTIEPQAVGWLQQEMADFYRAHRLLNANGVAIGMDSGVADDGAPWMTFFDRATHDVFMHVARIDGACILACDQFGLYLTADRISGLISSFEIEVRRLIDVRQQAKSNVVLHPAARIIMSISAMFLLFKLENDGAAFAKSNMSELESSTKKHEANVSGAARAHAVLGRLYDFIDTPTAVAALAGVLLSQELSKLASEIRHPTDATELQKGSDYPIDVVYHDIFGADEQQDSQLPIIVESLDSLTPAISMVEIRIAEPQQQATVSKTIKLAPPKPVNSEVYAEDPSTAPLDEKAIEPLPDTDVKDGQIAPKLALQVLKDLGLIELFAFATQSAEIPSEIGDINLATLDQLGSDVGLFHETSMSGSALTDAIAHFLNLFEGFEIEYSGGSVLIEQNSAKDLGEKLVGIWTNIMADGSEISVVGQIDYIDDVLTMGVA